MAARHRSSRKPQSAMDAAIARYAKLSRRNQMRVLMEILETRSFELAHAYAGVVRLGIGQRRRRTKSGRAEIQRGEPLCVLFMVERKWPRGSRSDRDGAIPRYLTAYAEVRGQRRLVAVPTDIDPHWLRKARAHTAIDVGVGGAGSTVAGSVCCVIRSSRSPSRKFGISCRHVLSSGTFAADPSDFVLQDGTRIGAVVATRGASQGPHVMDAQLFRITRANADLPRHKGSVQADVQCPCPIRHNGPSLNGGPRNGEYRAHWQAAASGSPPPDEWMFVGELLEVDLNAETQDGDSGSSVVTREAEPRLLGMHIGRSDEHANVSVCIPAWRFLDPAEYENVPSGAVWTLE
jgi:hypothetical protein